MGSDQVMLHPKFKHKFKAKWQKRSTNTFDNLTIADRLVRSVGERVILTLKEQDKSSDIEQQPPIGDRK